MRSDMKFCEVGIVMLILGGALGDLTAASPSHGDKSATASVRDKNTLRAIMLPREEQDTLSARNERAVLKYLRPALRSVGGAGRLSYLAPCYGNDGDPVPFPTVNVQVPTKGKTGLAAVREMFKNDKEVLVTEQRSGVINVMIGKAPAEVLQTRISLVTLKPLEQYNAVLAITAITKTKEVAAVMRKLRLEEPLVIAGLGIVEPEKGLPHLPPSMKDITVDQALDLVAKTFKGIVFYGACVDPSGERLYFVDFVEVVPLYVGESR